MKLSHVDTRKKDCINMFDYHNLYTYVYGIGVRAAIYMWRSCVDMIIICMHNSVHTCVSTEKNGHLNIHLLKKYIMKSCYKADTTLISADKSSQRR